MGGPSCLLLLMLSALGSGLAADFGTPTASVPAPRRRVSWRSEVEWAQNYTSGTEATKHYQGETLAYITPWNPSGKVAARHFSKKLTFAVPVWLQLRMGPEAKPVRTEPSDLTQLTITGQHELDVEWIEALQSDGVMVAPRVMWEAGELSSAQQEAAADKLVELVKAHSLDGLTVELPDVPRHISWLERLCTGLHALPAAATNPAMRHAVCVVVMPPPVPDDQGRIVGGTTVDHFRAVARVADRISLMTYDFSIARRQPGPNAPLPWMEFCAVEIRGPLSDEDFMLGEKLLLGLPFYGYDMGDAVVGHSYLDLLKKHEPDVKFDSRSKEHFFIYLDTSVGADGQVQRNKRLVHFPTRFSIQQRLDLSHKVGVAGVAIWELGQGLPSFFEQL